MTARVIRSHRGKPSHEKKDTSAHDATTRNSAIDSHGTTSSAEKYCTTVTTRTAAGTNGTTRSSVNRFRAVIARS